jgi:hypothetical protein
MRIINREQSDVGELRIGANLIEANLVVENCDEDVLAKRFARQGFNRNFCPTFLSQITVVHRGLPEGDPPEVHFDIDDHQLWMPRSAQVLASAIIYPPSELKTNRVPWARGQALRGQPARRAPAAQTQLSWSARDSF